MVFMYRGDLSFLSFSYALKSLPLPLDGGEMTRIFKFDRPLKGVLDDAFISFNVARSGKNRSGFPRQVVIRQAFNPDKTLFPGINEKRERALRSELRQYQNWKTVKAHSFPMQPYLFSMLWRFKLDSNTARQQIKNLEPVPLKTAKEIKKCVREYHDFICHNLSPGQIYLMPDAAITFGDPRRLRQSYSRRVLILEASNSQVVLVPFSKKLHRINPALDVLFDSGHQGPRLQPQGRPAVENFPYKIFQQRTALFVCAAQPVTRQAFLETALIPIGAVNKDLIHFVKEKLKNV